MKKRGITLITLVTTITIAMILITTITISAFAVANNGKKINFATEIMSLQQSVDSYVIKNDGNYPIGNSIIVDVSLLSDAAKKQFTDNGETITSDNHLLLYEIDYQKINNSSLKYGKQKNGENDIYVVSNTTGRVYYAKGLKIGKDTYFTLTQELISLLKYGSNKDLVLDSNAIVFVPSTTTWTNQDVSVQIKVPKIFTITSITAGGTNLVQDAVASNNDLVYNIYNASKAGNYSIVIKYKEASDGIEKTARYHVENVDKEAPILEISNFNEVQADELVSLVGYINITKKEDKLSGIQKVLYENDKIEKNVKDYFSTVSQEVKGDAIPVTAGTKYITIYVEDKAGNYKTAIKEITVTTKNKIPVMKNLKAYLNGYQNVEKGIDTTSTTWKDMSGNGNDAILYNFAYDETSGWMNHSLRFDNVNDYIKIDNTNGKMVSKEQDFTIELVFSCYATRNTHIISSGMGITYFDLYNTGLIRCMPRATSNTANIWPAATDQSMLTLNTIHTMSITMKKTGDNFVIQIYGDGKKLPTSSNVGIKQLDISAFFVGRDYQGIISCPINLYSVRIYDRALDDNEMKYNYQTDVNLYQSK